MMEKVSSVSFWYKRRRVKLIWILSKEEAHALLTRDKGPEDFVILFSLCNYYVPMLWGGPPHLLSV